MITTSSSCIQCGLLNELSTMAVACDLVGVAGGRRIAALYDEEFGITILGSEREDVRFEALGGDEARMAFGVRGVIGVNGVTGVMGVIGVTGVIGGMFGSEKNVLYMLKILSTTQNAIS